MSKDREIWFRRILWGYFPVHWKGWITLIVGISIIVPTYSVGLMLSDIHPVLSTASYALAIVVFLALFIIAKRYSNP